MLYFFTYKLISAETLRVRDLLIDSYCPKKRKTIRYNPRVKFLTVTSHLSEQTSLKILGKSESVKMSTSVDLTKGYKYYHMTAEICTTIFSVTIA